MFKRLKVIGVIGSNKDEWDEFAAPLGHALAVRNVNLLTGGGRGVMTSVARSFTSCSARMGISIGCIPSKKTPDGSYVAKEGYPNPFTEFTVVSPLDTFNPRDPDQINRNFLNVMSSDVVIALPGRTGTRNEISLCQKFNKPIILHGPVNEWDDLSPEFLREPNLGPVLTWLDQQLQFTPT